VEENDMTDDVETTSAPPFTGIQPCRPFPDFLVTGHTLKEFEADEITDALVRRDLMIEEYNRHEQSLKEQMRGQHEYIQGVLRAWRVPLVGFGVQEGEQNGMYHDRWVGPRLTLTILPRRRVSGVVLHGWVPDEMPEGGQLAIQVGDLVAHLELRPGLFNLPVEIPGGTDAAIPLTVESSKSVRPEGPDKRQVAFVLREIELEHPEYAPALMARLEARRNQSATPAEPSSAGDTKPRRTVILHYHLFKNAGTSVDKVLKANFGEAWGEQEFELPRDAKARVFYFNTGKVLDYLRDHPELKALSSHTGLPPVPEIDGVSIFPIVFIRHPIDRLRSAYLFEVTQDATSYGSRLAKAQGFSGYLRELIRHPFDRTARNFQTYRLSANEPAAAGSELERAMRVLETFEFVGLVEAYDASMARLQDLLAPRVEGFRGFIVRENASQPEHIGLAEKLALIRTEMGEALYDDVVAANSDDIALFEAMARRYGFEP
jgi:hypothetical protein